jgi:hypothetical protein
LVSIDERQPALCAARFAHTGVAPGIEVVEIADTDADPSGALDGLGDRRSKAGGGAPHGTAGRRRSSEGLQDALGPLVVIRLDASDSSQTVDVEDHPVVGSPAGDRYLRARSDSGVGTPFLCCLHPRKR